MTEGKTREGCRFVPVFMLLDRMGWEWMHSVVEGVGLDHSKQQDTILMAKGQPLWLKSPGLTVRFTGDLRAVVMLN